MAGDEREDEVNSQDAPKTQPAAASALKTEAEADADAKETKTVTFDDSVSVMGRGTEKLVEDGNSAESHTHRTEMDELRSQVKKLQNMMMVTGRQVMELRLEQQRAGIAELDRKSKELSQAANLTGTNSEFVSSTDLLDLVRELQTQLDILDDRIIRRIVNSRVTGSDRILPLQSSSADFPEIFPMTLDEFEKIEEKTLDELCEFYELFPPDAAEVEQLLDKVQLTPEQAGVTLPTGPRPSLAERFNKLSEFLGLVVRRKPEAVEPLDKNTTLSDKAPASENESK